jgi:hypothetical protein
METKEHIKKTVINSLTSMLTKSDDNKQNKKIVIHNTGEGSLISLTNQYKSKMEKGILHFQRSYSPNSIADFFKTAVIDIWWIQKYFGKICHMNSIYRINEEDVSYQLFIVIRLSNKMIIEYGLVSQPTRKQEFLQLDLGLKGITATYDESESQSAQSDKINKNAEKFKTVILNDKEYSTIKKIIYKLIQSFDMGGEER